MILGPDQIIACPHCGGLSQHCTLVSGNTFGAQVWTDGKQVAPMLLQPPPVVKCAHCARCYWLADAEEIATVYLRVKGERNIDPAWRKAPLAEEPSETEYYAAMEDGLAEDRVQERNLRVLAWWRGNDAVRNRDPAPRETPAISQAGRTNLERLADLLDDDDDSDRLMKAEVLRELGQFEAAGKILDGITSDNVTRILRRIRSLCDDRDACVREIT